MSKSQGAIEYLMILGAVILISAIVIFLVSSFSGKKEVVLYQECQNGIKKAIATKSALGLSVRDVDQVKGDCLACFKYDKELLKLSNINDGITENDISLGPLNYVSLFEINTFNGKQINYIYYPNFVECLTVSSSGANKLQITAGSKLIAKIYINSNYKINGYQVKVPLAQVISNYGHNLSFYDSNFNLLPYCFEQPSGECNQTPSNTVWIKVNLNKGSNLIYVFNKTLGLTNGKGVFDFYDDFNSGTLNKNIWAVSTNNPSEPKIINGELYLSDKEGKYYTEIYLKNKILRGNNETLFIKYYLSSNNGENDFWIHYPHNGESNYLENFQDEYWRWIRFKINSLTGDVYWLPGGSTLLDNWTGISITRSDNKFIMKYYRPWNSLYKTYEYTYTGSTDLDQYFGQTGSILALGTCCGNYRTLKIDFIYAKKYLPQEPTIQVAVM